MASTRTYPAFPAENQTVSNCGGTWWHDLTVTGRLPGTGGYGSDLLQTLDAVARVPDERLPAADYGSGQTAEVELRAKAAAGIDRVRQSMFLNENWLTSKDEAGINWLLDRAAAELDFIDRTHEKWDEWPGATGYPLTREDTVYGYLPIRPSGSASCDEPHLTCPTANDLAQRVVHRRAIRKALRRALRYIRCADYWGWRTILQRQAQERLEALPPDQQPGRTDAADSPSGTDPFRCWDRVYRNALRTRPEQQARLLADAQCGEKYDICWSRAFRLALGQGLPPNAAGAQADRVCGDPIDHFPPPDSLPDPDEFPPDEEPTAPDTAPVKRPKTALAIGAAALAALLIAPRILK